MIGAPPFGFKPLEGWGLGILRIPLFMMNLKYQKKLIKTVGIWIPSRRSEARTDGRIQSAIQMKWDRKRLMDILHLPLLEKSIEIEPQWRHHHKVSPPYDASDEVSP
jgi:hypothetical protein